MSSREGLIKIVGIDNVFDSQEVLDSYPRNHSFVTPLSPWFVVKPKNVEEV